jgi:energy-converting hydrogenase B subunit D
MGFLQVVAMVLVAAGGLAVVVAREPIRQALAASLYGLTLTVLFLVFQAPDVALSMATVGAVAMPLMIVMALGKTRRNRP